jgi:hypothetical protein
VDAKHRAEIEALKAHGKNDLLDSPMGVVFQGEILDKSQREFN